MLDALLSPKASVHTIVIVSVLGVSTVAQAHRQERTFGKIARFWAKAAARFATRKFAEQLWRPYAKNQLFPKWRPAKEAAVHPSSRYELTEVTATLPFGKPAFRWQGPKRGLSFIGEVRGRLVEFSSGRRTEEQWDAWLVTKDRAESVSVRVPLESLLMYVGTLGFFGGEIVVEEENAQ